MVSKSLINKEQYEVLQKKIESDISHGFKVLGNYSNQIDTIRVVTTYNQKAFLVIVASSKRFKKKSTNLIEIQSFEGKGGYKLSMALSDNNTFIMKPRFTKLGINFTSSTETPSNSEKDDFIKNYLNSKPSRHLTKDKLEQHTYNEKDYEWVNPSSE